MYVRTNAVVLCLPNGCTASFYIRNTCITSPRSLHKYTLTGHHHLFHISLPFATPKPLPLPLAQKYTVFTETKDQQLTVLGVSNLQQDTFTIASHTSCECSLKTSSPRRPFPPSPLIAYSVIWGNLLFFITSHFSLSDLSSHT